MSWDALLGEHVLMSIRTDVHHPFSNEANGVAFELDQDLVVLIFEDPNDGYRSSANEPMIMKGNLYELGCSPEYIRVPVLVKNHERSEYGGASRGIEMLDRRNGKTILIIGTDNSDDYYPSWVCEWTPANIAENEP